MRIKDFYHSKWFDAILFLLMFMIPFILYRDLFIQNMLLANGDSIGFSTSVIFENKAILQGEFPLWNKYLSNGAPFAADLTNKVFYLPQILLSWLSPKTFIYVFYSLHISMGAFFTYLYLKEINCGKTAAICIGLMYLLSIQMGGARKGHMMIIITIVYLPVILFFIERYIRTGKIKWLLFSSFSMALQFYSGFVQDVFYTDVVVFIYLLALGIKYRIEIKKMLLHGCAWFFTYMGLIMIQLLPTLQLIIEYQKLGAEKIPYDSFLTYSIHFIKIFMMLFPQVFNGEIFQKFGPYYSSEMDIEIFLGVLVFVFIIFGITQYFKDFRIKLATFMMLCSFIYAANAHIPILSKFLYQLPFVGDFRCPSRILFVFIFFGYVICGITLSKLRNKEEVEKLTKFIIKFTSAVLIVLSIAGIGIVIYEGSRNFPQEELKAVISYFKNSYIKTIIILVVGSALFFIFNIIKDRLSSAGYKVLYTLISFVFLFITISETYQYAIISNPVSEDVMVPNDYASIKLAENIGNYNVWDAFPSLDGAHESIISQNKSIAKGIPSINSYISFNNPRLYKLFSQDTNSKLNFSGLMTGSIKASQNLLLQNDLLSMLGVKYIIDSSNLIGEQGETIQLGEKSKTILDESEIVIPNANGGLYVYSKEVFIKPYTFYYVSFDYDSSENQELFYVDFYGGELYDKQEQQANLTILKGNGSEGFYIYSGDSGVSNQIALRIVCTPIADTIVKNFKLNEVETSVITDVYIPYIVDENNRIFENKNAKDILYSPQDVKSIKSSKDIYENIFDYNLDNTSYVENFKNIDLKNVNTSISSIDFKINSITAKVSSTESSFINFSQNYYPGWKAYVNGELVQIYMVNGLIQGIEVPEGDSIIKFEFTAPMVLIGGVVTLITFLLALYIIWKESTKKISK